MVCSNSAACQLASRFSTWENIESGSGSGKRTILGLDAWGHNIFCDQSEDEHWTILCNRRQRKSVKRCLGYAIYQDGRSIYAWVGCPLMPDQRGINRESWANLGGKYHSTALKTVLQYTKAIVKSGEQYWSGHYRCREGKNICGLVYNASIRQAKWNSLREDWQQ